MQIPKRLLVVPLLGAVLLVGHFGTDTESTTQTKVHLGPNGTLTTQVTRVAQVSGPGLAHAAIVPSGQTDNSICLWTQPSGAGDMLCLSGMGRALLSDFPIDPNNPSRGTWAGAVRSYRANNTHGYFRGPAPSRRREAFGPNYEVLNAGQHARSSQEIIVSWQGWDRWIQSGSIVSVGDDIPNVTRPSAFCMDLLPGQVDADKNQLVQLNECSAKPGTLEQKWQYVNSGGQIRNLKTGTCLASGRVVGASGFERRLVLKGCPAPTSTTWQWDAARMRWVWVGTNQCITILGNKPQFGAALSLYDCDSDWSQRWLPYFYTKTGQWSGW